MQTNTAIEKPQERRIARPLKVLVPLIKHDLDDGAIAAKQAGMPYYIAAGEKLLEAKASNEVSPLGWGDWLNKNFHLSQYTAREYMRLAKKNNEGITFETLSHARGDRRSHHKPSWTDDVRDVLKNLRTESFNLRQRDISLAKEQKLNRELGLQLIEIGYKVLAVKLHPDKGGSDEAMQRLNVVRDHLKEVA